MRWRRGANKQEDAGSSADEQWDAGWRMSSGGAAATASLARWGLWGLVAAGPVVGLLAWSSASGSEPASEPRVAAKPEPVVDTAGPGGFAELFVTTFLSVSADQSQRLDAFLPGASARVSGAVEPVAVDRAATVRVQPQSRSYWAVTVAVQVAPVDGGAAKEEAAKGQAQDGAGGLRFFRVPVTAAAGAEGFVAVSLPSEVGAPESGEGRGLGYGRPGPAHKSDPAAGTIQGFFESYLAGRGEVERFLAPKTSVPALLAAPYEQVRIVEWAVRGADQSEAPEEAAAPADGERREVVVEVEAAEQAGQWRPMTYALVLTARDGRWEVAELSDAPRLASGGGGK